MATAASPYLRHRFPPEIIAQCVLLYMRFPLSFRAVEDAPARGAGQLRDHSPLVPEVRPAVRQRAAPSAASARRQVACHQGPAPPGRYGQNYECFPQGRLAPPLISPRRDRVFTPARRRAGLRTFRARAEADSADRLSGHRARAPSATHCLSPVTQPFCALSMRTRKCATPLYKAMLVM